MQLVIIRQIIVLVLLNIYIISFCLPVTVPVDLRKVTAHLDIPTENSQSGLDIFVYCFVHFLGGSGIRGPDVTGIWIVNPLMWVALICIPAGQHEYGLSIAIMAFSLGGPITFLLASPFYPLFSGYYVWAGSILMLLLAHLSLSIIARTISRNHHPNTG
jgi:hypothetical protein